MIYKKSQDKLLRCAFRAYRHFEIILERILMQVDGPSKGWAMEDMDLSRKDRSEEVEAI